MCLIVIAGVPFSNSISSFLKKRNLPHMLTPFYVLKLLELTIAYNLRYLKTIQDDKFASTRFDNFDLDKENTTIKWTKPDRDSKIMLMYYNQTGLNIDGAEQIFFSIMQSPAFLFFDNTWTGLILISIAIFMFSPYMYIFCIEGAAVSYFTSLAVGK